jgi:hypothetical protein
MAYPGETPLVKKKGHLDLDREELEALSKAELIKIILDQREMFYDRIEEKDKRINELTEQLAGLNRQLDEQKNKEINRHVNEPSSKKPEWDKDGNPKKKKKRKKKRKKRPGCGNVKKTDMEPEEVHHIPLDSCPDCGTDLSDRKGRENSGRIVEDIAPPQDKTILSKEIEESKWCPRCKKTVSSKTEKALPGSDIGLNAAIEMAYLWVMSALSLPKIQALVQSFKALPISTAGISRIMIRFSGILQPVYDEILADVRGRGFGPMRRVGG